MAKARKRVAQHVSIEWYGDQFLEIVDQYGDAALFAAGEVLLQEAVSRAPRRSGNLVESGYVGTRSRSTYRRRRYWRKKIRPDANTAVVAFTAPHAHLVESGRRRTGRIQPRAKQGKKALRIGDGQLRARSRYRRMSGKPFVGPALDATRDGMSEAITKVLHDRLESEMPR